MSVNGAAWRALVSPSTGLSTCSTPHGFLMCTGGSFCTAIQRWWEAHKFQVQLQHPAEPTCNWCGLGSSGSRDGMPAFLTPAMSL